MSYYGVNAYGAPQENPDAQRSQTSPYRLGSAPRPPTGATSASEFAANNQSEFGTPVQPNQTNQTGAQTTNYDASRRDTQYNQPAPQPTYSSPGQSQTDYQRSTEYTPSTTPQQPRPPQTATTLQQQYAQQAQLLSAKQSQLHQYYLSMGMSEEQARMRVQQSTQAEMDSINQLGAQLNQQQPTTGANAPAPTAPTGTPQQYSFSGFDMNRVQDPSKSAKDSFLAAAQAAAQSGAPMPRTHEEAQAWAQQYIVPVMQQNGYQVHQIIGDKMWVTSRENPAGGWVDYLINSGGGNPQIGWQADVSPDQTNAGQTPWTPQGAAPASTGNVVSATPTSPDPFTAMGGGVWTGTGWIPKDNPAAQQFLNTVPQPGAQPTTPGGPTPSGYNAPQFTGSAYQVGQAPNVSLNPFQSNALPTTQYDAYGGTQFAQYQAPSFGVLNGLAQGSLEHLLANPAFSQNWIQGQNAQQREAALQMQQNALQQMREGAAARGSYGSGQLAGGEARLGQATMEQILGAQRATAMTAEEKEAENRRLGISTANDWMTGQTNRADTDYRAQMLGQATQASDAQAAIASRNAATDYALALAQAQNNEGYRDWTTQKDAATFAWDQYMDREGLNKDAAQSALDVYGQTQYTPWLAGQNLRQGDLDRQLGYAGLANAKDIATMSNQLATKEFEDNMAKWRAQLNFNYANSALNANSAMGAGFLG